MDVVLLLIYQILGRQGEANLSARPMMLAHRLTVWMEVTCREDHLCNYPVAYSWGIDSGVLVN